MLIKIMGIKTYLSSPRINALNFTSPSVTASSLFILNTSSFSDLVIGPANKTKYFSGLGSLYNWV